MGDKPDDEPQAEAAVVVAREGVVEPADEPQVEAAEDLNHEGEVEEADEYELTVTEESLMRLHGLTVTLPLPCDLCPIGTVFDNLEEFDTHMIEHAEAKMFACQLCSNTYRSWSNLVAHRKMFHLGEVLSCEACGTRKSHERLEGAVNFPVDGKPHGCEECLIGLDSLKDVYRHFFFHKAPPGGSRRKGCNYWSTPEEKLPVMSESGRVSTSKIFNGGLASKSKGKQKVFISGTPIISINGSTAGSIVSPSGTLPGTLIACQSGDVAAVPNNTLNPSRIQNGDVIGKLLAIPKGTLIKNLPGIKDGRLVLKPFVIKGKLLGSQIKKMSVKPIKKFGGEVIVNPNGLQSDDSNINQPGTTNVTLLGDLTNIGTEITPGNTTVAKSLSSPVNSSKTQDEISSGDSHNGNQSGNQNIDQPEISSVSVNALVAEEPKSSPDKSGGSNNCEGMPRFIPLAPKGGLENILDLKDLISKRLSKQDGKEAATIGNMHSCPHCSFTSAKWEEYRKHLVSNSVAHDCVMCSSNHLKRLSMTDHEYCQAKNHPFCCIPCATPFASSEEFVSHLNKCHSSSFLPCCLCGRQLYSLMYLDHLKSCQQKHIQWELRNQPKHLTCEECNKTFRSNIAIRKHMKRHEANLKAPVDCKTCGRVFQHKGAYSMHLWGNPTHGPPELRAKIPGSSTNYVCEKCGKTFAKKGGLKEHLLRHAGLKPHACPSCPKSFVTRTSLILHVRQHTGERPYMCEICGKNFTGPTSFYVHQRRHRTGEDVIQVRRPYSYVNKQPNVDKSKFTCPVCGKTLSTKLIYEGHIRQHTGERPFVCEICGRGFTTRKIKRVHIKRHEKERILKKVEAVRWVHDVSDVVNKDVMDVEGGFDSNSSNNCIFVCPRCGVGLVSPDELEEHLAKGDCTSGGPEMFVLPMTSESECIDTGSMVVVGQHES